ncbi:unnamed protein product [Allacma fusca]|uniref:Uncharacterized protein n=1 Tax=Allacma fusca TaxID=39272 RepID=A0A8J2PK75_9HEXA|nr:unnamed protein product [Allacma fusca]
MKVHKFYNMLSTYEVTICHGSKCEQQSYPRNRAGPQIKCQYYDFALTKLWRKRQAFVRPSLKESITDMPSEISQYAIDEAVWDDAKGSDIKRHDMDEKIDAFHRALICLGGDIPQKIYGAHALPNLALLNTERTFLEVFPVIETELKRTPNLNFHSEAASSIEPLFKQVMKVRNTKWIKQIITLVINSLNNNDPEIVTVWIQSMERVIDQLSPKDAAAQILPVVIEKSVKSNSVISKNSANALLRKLLSHTQTGSDIATKVKYVGSSKLLSALATNIMLRAEDTEPIVKIAVIDAICQLLVAGKGDVYQQKMFIATLKKLVRGAYHQNPPHVELLIRFTGLMGPVTKGPAVKSIFTEEDKYWFLDAFLCLSTFGLPGTSREVPPEMPPGFVAYRRALGANKTSLVSTLLSTPVKVAPIAEGTNVLAGHENSKDENYMVRANCADAFLDFLKFGKPTVHFKDGLHKTFHNYFDDPSPTVRKNISGSLYLIMQEVDSDIILCKDEMIRALSDDNMDVIEAVIPHLSDMLKLFVNNDILSPEKATAAAAEIGGVLLFCEERLSQTRDWRIHSSLLLQMVVLPFCLPSDILFQNFVPIILHRLLHLKQLPSRLGAAEALISLLRHCRRANQRDEIRRKIKAFAQSRNAQDRMIYLYMSDIIMNRFSRKYYRQHFVEPTLGLAEDKISNLLKKLEELVAKIQQSENDRDALEAISVAVEQMAEIGVIQNLEVHRRRLKEEKDDKKKEMEENYIAGLEDKLPKANTAKRYSLLDKGVAGKVVEKTKPNHTYLPSTLEKPVNLPKLSYAAKAAVTSPSSINPTAFRYKQSFPRTSKNIVPLAKKDARVVPPSEGSSHTTTTEAAAPREGPTNKPK